MGAKLFFEVSAKTGHNVGALFFELSNLLLKSTDESVDNPG